MTTQDLINRLRDTASKGVSVWGDLQMEAAKEIETLLAERECYASAMDRMQAALVEPSEPYAIAYEYDGPFGVHQSFTYEHRNGKYPDRSFPVFKHPAPSKPEPYDPIGAWNKGFEEGKRLSKPSPLTDEEIEAVYATCHKGKAYPQDNVCGPKAMRMAEARAIEAAVWEKMNGK